MDNQPEKQESVSKERLILQVTLDDKQNIKLRIESKHTPSLSYIHKLLGVEIDKLIIDEQIRMRAPQGRIITDIKKHSIIDFLRRKPN